MKEEDNRSISLSQPVSDYNSLNLRLNPEPLLAKIEVFLRGEKEIIYEGENGEACYKTVKIGLKKANENGIQSIYNWISGVVNIQTVQGNFPVDARGYSKAYEDYIYNFRIDFSKYLMLNKYDFEISDTEYTGIIDFVLFLIVPYMSRLIGNEERKGYNNTLKSDDRTVYTDNKNQGASLFT